MASRDGRILDIFLDPFTPVIFKEKFRIFKSIYFLKRSSITRLEFFSAMTTIRRTN